MLDCCENKLKSLDVSSNVLLKELYCYQNPIQSLDVNKNVELEKLYCQGCELRELDVSLNPNLKTLLCSQNTLTRLDISNNTALEGLFCSNNDISELDVSKNSALNYLMCDSNQLKALDIINNTNLMRIRCYGNQIKHLFVGNCTFLLTAMDEGKEISQEDEESGIPYVGFNYGNVYYIFVDPTTEILRVAPTPTPTVTPTPTQTSTPVPTKPATPTPTLTSTPVPTNVPTKVPTTTPTKAPTQNPTPTKQPTLTPTPAPSKGSIADFVERLYTVALGRASEKDGKEFWVKEITNGNKTGADCGLFFLTSEEFNNRGLSIENFVETLYQTFFGRDSEPNGKAYWVGELKSGRKSRTDVIWGFIDSKEWCNICADYGVRSGAPTAKADHASQNAIDFATRLYTCCLGRDPEDGGLKFWSLALTNLEKTGAEAAQLFFESQEFVNLLLDDREYITRLYTTFMDRQPEEGGMNYWLGEMKKGKTRREVMAWFAQSPEFTNICKKYGIARGEVNMNAPLPPKPSADLKKSCEKLASQVSSKAKEYGYTVTTRVLRNSDTQYGIEILCAIPRGTLSLGYAAKAELGSDGSVKTFYAVPSLSGSEGYDDYSITCSYDSIVADIVYYASNPV